MVKKGPSDIINYKKAARHERSPKERSRDSVDTARSTLPRKWGDSWLVFDERYGDSPPRTRSRANIRHRRKELFRDADGRRPGSMFGSDGSGGKLYLVPVTYNISGKTNLTFARRRSQRRIVGYEPAKQTAAITQDTKKGVKEESGGLPDRSVDKSGVRRPQVFDR